MDMLTRRRALLIVALVVAVAACDDSGATPNSGDVTTAPDPASPAPPATVPPATGAAGTAAPTLMPSEPTTAATVGPTSSATAAEPGGWKRVDAPVGCQCADGSPFSFWVREADPEKVVLFFQGGGACFSAETCSFSAGLYKTTTGAGDDPSAASGIFDFADERNPLADWSFVFVPYCTGDVHLGNATTAYSPDLTVRHVGSVNGTAAVDHLAGTFPDATDVLVAGESAGSVPSPLYAGLVSDRLPSADIDVLADGSGAYPDVPGINALIGDLWGTTNAIPDWPESAGLTAETWSFPGLFIQAGRHDPAITFARHDYAYDGAQEFFAGLAGIPAEDLLELIDGNETQIETAGVPLASYIAPGDAHTVLSRDLFYTEEVNGVALVDWVADLIDEQPVADVHCTDCAG